MKNSKSFNQIARDVNRISAKDNAFFARNEHLKAIEKSNDADFYITKELSYLAYSGIGILALMPEDFRPSSDWEIVLIFLILWFLVSSIIYAFIGKSYERKLWQSFADVSMEITSLWFETRSKLFNPNRDPVEFYAKAIEKQSYNDAKRFQRTPDIIQKFHMWSVGIGAGLEVAYLLIQMIIKY